MSDYGRNAMIVRQWRLLVLLRGGRVTKTRLARELGVSERTVYRDVIALGQIFPIVETRDTFVSYALNTMAEWPRQSVTPIQELRA